METYVCIKCGKEKPKEDFYTHRNKVVQAICRECFIATPIHEVTQHITVVQRREGEKKVKDAYKKFYRKNKKRKHK